MGAAGVSMYSKSSDVSDTACDIPVASEVERRDQCRSIGGAKGILIFSKLAKWMLGIFLGLGCPKCINLPSTKESIMTTRSRLKYSRCKAFPLLQYESDCNRTS